ncbi:MAG: hypothetical protein RL681_277 [Candidatus Parcubacteria bacterium]|jgi:hypothetical protein
MQEGRSRIVIGGGRPSAPKTLLQQSMGAAIGLAAIIIVLGIFMPSVLHGLETFLLTFFDRATAVMDTIQPNQSATIIHALQ